MAFLEEEIENYLFKYAHGIFGTGNRSTAPYNSTWYEEYFAMLQDVDAGMVYDFSLVPEAKDLVTAQANAAANPTLISDRTQVGAAIHMTPSPNQKVFFATQTYGDLTTRIKRFLKPQNHPRSDVGFEGMPSVGYMPRIYNGDPDAGGVEITTSQDQVGARTGWSFHCGTGALMVAASFSGIVDPADVWMRGFVWIGPTGGGGSTETYTAVLNKVYPYEKEYRGTVYNVSDETELDTAIGSIVAYDVINLTANITITSSKTIPVPCKITGPFTISTAGTAGDPVTMVTVNADDVFIDSDVTFRHLKTTNTSVETVFNVNALNFVSKAIVEFMEFGYMLRGSFRIEGKTTYTGALGNNHRHIMLYSVLAPSIINNVEWDFPAEGTPRSRFIEVSSSGGSEFNAVLKVANNTQKDLSKICRQFYIQDSFIKSPTGKPSIYFYDNKWNDLNGGIGLYSGINNPLSFFTYVIMIRNYQGNAGIASYKGLFYIDGTGAGWTIGNCKVILDKNQHLGDASLRPGYTSAFQGVAYNDAIYTNPIPLAAIADYIGVVNPEEISMEAGVGDIFNNLTPTEISVGGIPIGSTFNNQTMEEMWDRLLYPELFPVLTPPSSTFTLAQAGLQEVGLLLATLNFGAAFNRGSISPPYGTSGFRSGLPNTYRYIGSGLADNPSTALTDTQAVIGYTVLLGDQSWQGRVSYDIGEQPLSNKGNNYDFPLPAGDTSWVTRTITGVYPYFGTTVAIGTQTKQPLAVHNAAYWQLNMVAESGIDKQRAWFPQAFSAITGIQFYNTVSGAWEWLNGSKANSLLMFTVTVIQIDINGTLIDYNVYTHNGSLIGARQLRFYTT